MSGHQDIENKIWGEMQKPWLIHFLANRELISYSSA